MQAVGERVKPNKPQRVERLVSEDTLQTPQAKKATHCESDDPSLRLSVGWSSLSPALSPVGLLCEARRNVGPSPPWVLSIL
jgi:hypothetical protein